MVALLPQHETLQSVEQYKPDTETIWGEDFYSSIVEVQDNDNLMELASEYGVFFGVNQDYTPALALMIKNKILGPEADQLGLSNIGRHSILSGKTSELTCGEEMLQLDKDWQYVINMASYGHEYTKGLQILGCSQSSETINGHCRHKVDNSYYSDYESNQPAIFQATSMYWPYDRWIKEGMIGHMLVRSFDSIVGPEILADGTLGEDKLQHWGYRIAELQQRKAEASEEEGKKYNYPSPAFTYLGEKVMPALENHLFNMLLKNHPELINRIDSDVLPEAPFSSIILHHAKMKNMPVIQ